MKTPISVDGAVNLLLISLNAFYFSTNRHIGVNSCHYSRLIGSYFHLVHYGDILNSHVNCLSKQMSNLMVNVEFDIRHLKQTIQLHGKLVKPLVLGVLFIGFA